MRKSSEEILSHNPIKHPAKGFSADSIMGIRSSKKTNKNEYHLRWNVWTSLDKTSRCRRWNVRKFTCSNVGRGNIVRVNSKE